jgi:AcrR family transcriptional regulator
MATAPRWQRLERDERREQILSCARRLFSERSYATVSTSQIAAEAGVARGLLHHYFGTKRDLYLEVVRSLVRTPASPVPGPGAGRSLQDVISESVDRWLTMIERNRGTWLAAIGAQGLGHDPEVEAILDEAREAAAGRLIAALGVGGADGADGAAGAAGAAGVAGVTGADGAAGVAGAPERLRAVVRAYGGMAEAASVEWLQRGRLTRDEVHALLVQGFFSSVGEVRDAVERAAAGGEPGQPAGPR